MRLARGRSRSSPSSAVLSVVPAPRTPSSSPSARTRSSTASSTGGCCKGPHVDLYYYPAEAELAPPALAYAEASYDTLSVQFGHTVPTRIPLIVYASHTDFEQTNILPFTPPEGLLGATDFLKRRVALPFRGNFAEFRHTMRHEMVHVFQLDLLVESYNLAPRAQPVQLPALVERGPGRAVVGGQDARDEMVMRDLTLSGRLPPLQAARLCQRRHRVSDRRPDPSLARRHLRRLARRR